MKVIFVCKNFNASNVVKQPWAHIRHLVIEFAALGVSSEVVSYGEGAPGKVEDVGGVHVHRLGGRIRIDAGECARKVTEFDADVLSWYSGLFPSSLDIANVTTATSSRTIWNITQRRISVNEMAGLGIRDACSLKQLAVVYSYSLVPSYFVRAAARRVSAIVVPTARARTSVMSMGVSEETIYQIGSGIDGALFSQMLSKDEAIEIRERSGFERDDFVLCYFGSISNLRGFDVALKAFSILRTKVANARLLVLGRHEPSTRWDSLGQHVGISLLTRILEPEEVAKYLMACDVVVLPFKFWPVNEWPLTILEAMAAGRVVVTTPIPLAQDVISDGVDGFVIPSGNPHVLARLLETLANDEDRRIAVGKNAREVALANYDWSCIARETLELFKSIL